MSSSRRALVTGGAGFIGSHLVDRLLADGHEVIVLDNLATGRRENLPPHPGNARLSFHRVDIAEPELIQPHFKGVDWVFHLAALADIVPSIQHPLQYHRANVNGTIVVLEAARASGVRRFVYTASASCYGIPDEYPTAETAPIRTMYPYALTKYLGECYALHWNQTYKVPCVSLRLFNVFGPRSRTTGAYGAVFGVFLAQKLAGKPFTVVGDGTQTRDFIFVTDVVDAFVRAAESGVEGEIFNVGLGNPHSVNYLVELLGGDVIHVPRRPGEPDRSFADIGKLSRVLGWRPRVTFEDGVRLMLENIGQWRDAPVWNRESIEEATRNWFDYLGNSSGG
ncbi:MAG TPA: SDR family oxidoreductase [Dehalococcoidales bacterium]|nr:MAG: NAD-dependent dehydratase [Chloroflexi bacterium RBG_16_60_22]HJX13618.1 SDR family oxidoreductase [Dehalococcoidales bacterium]